MKKSLSDDLYCYLSPDDVYDEGEDTSVELEGVEQTSSGGYMMKLSIPSVFFKYIIGKEGRTKANIERDTRCRMTIPNRGTEGDIGTVASHSTGP